MEAKRISCFKIELARTMANSIQHWPKHLWPVVGVAFLQRVNFVEAITSLVLVFIPILEEGIKVTYQFAFINDS